MKDCFDKELTQKIENIIRKASLIMLSAEEYRNMHIEEKSGSANFVTEYDVKVQRFLERKLKEIIPDCSFLCEEEGEDENPLGDSYTFIIDPIDGTTNFMLGRRASCISVALSKDKEPIYGAVYDPYHDLYYSAIKGAGAFCNKKPIRPSERIPRHAIASIGTAPYNRDTMARPVTEIVYGLLNNFADIRRIGSAALEICAVACGELDVYCEPVLSPWDFAAAALIAKEAGAIISQFNGAELNYGKKCSVVCANKSTYDTVMKVIEDKISI